jgi:DNA polymerase I-like protein with 3'-5' exonuclease and polymerase domains
VNQINLRLEKTIEEAQIRSALASSVHDQLLIEMAKAIVAVAERKDRAAVESEKEGVDESR